MTLSNLTVTIKGALWMLYAVEVENNDVTGKWKDDDGGGSVTLKDVALSEDNVLDVFISLGAPNGTAYTVALSGKTEDAKTFTYAEDFKVVKNGKLKITITKNINDLIHG